MCDLPRDSARYDAGHAGRVGRSERSENAAACRQLILLIKSLILEFLTCARGYNHLGLARLNKGVDMSEIRTRQRQDRTYQDHFDRIFRRRKTPRERLWAWAWAWAWAWIPTIVWVVAIIVSYMVRKICRAIRT